MDIIGISSNFFVPSRYLIYVFLTLTPTLTITAVLTPYSNIDT